jgi:beta-lactamase regulating signal transducer with metallopeptidase domain
MMQAFQVLSSPGWESLVEALLHTLWIGALCAAVAGGVLRGLPAVRARRRQAVCLAGLLLTLVGGMAAWVVIERLPEREVGVAAPGAVLATAGGEWAGVAAEGAGAPAAVAAAEGLGASAAAERRIGAAAWVAAGWLIGVLGMLVRMGHAVAGAGRLRRAGRPAAAGEALRAIANELEAMLGMAGRVGLLVVDALSGPAVVGVWRPVILWPAAWATGMPEWQVRAILAHELAHIVRRDYLVNLLQMAVEALLFFNPAVWWMSRQARIEREACCDALAARMLGDSGEWDLARALAEAAGAANMPAGAMAFGGPPRRSLLERVRRLLEPAHRPTFRLPWPTLAGILALLLIGLAGLKLAGNAVADALMSHEERIARMESLQRQAPDYGEERRQDYGEEDRITVRGTIRAADGARLPGILQMTSDSDRPGHGYRSGYTLPGIRGATLNEEGTALTFEIPIEYGEIHLAVTSDGYAPAFAGPLRAEPGGVIDGVELVLAPGFPAEVLVTDEGSRPLRGVEIRARTEDPAQGWSASVTTDGDGMATIAHATTTPMTLNVRHPGYMEAEVKGFIASAAETFAWALAPARATTGRAVDAQTGEPLAGVELRLVARRGGSMGNMQWGSGNGPVLATSGNDGRFSIDTFADDAAYIVVAFAADTTHAGFFRMLPGETGRTLALERTLALAGTIRNADTLERYADGRPHRINWRLARRIGDEEVSLDGTVDVEDDDGADARFRITGVLPGRLTISGAGLHEALAVTGSSADLVLNREGTPTDLGTLQARLDEAHPMREVLVRLTSPAGAPMPSGALTAEYWRFIAAPATEEGFYRQTERIRIPLDDDGTVRLAVPTPNRLELKPQGLLGYWFPTLWHGDEGMMQAGGEIEAGEDPVEITLPLRPAGGIDGRLFDAHGQPARGLTISLAVEEMPDGMPGNSHGIEVKSSSRAGDDSSRFFAGPLPIGGTYRIVANQAWNYAVSEPIRITAEQPFTTLAMTMPEPVDLAGTVTDPEGTPIAGVKMELSFNVPGHGYGRNQAPLTGVHGNFRIPGLNPNPPEGAFYSLIATPTADYVPLSTTILPGDSPLHLTLQHGRTVEGIAVDAETGQPLRGLEVYAMGTWEKWYEEFPGFLDADAVTDENGHFRFTRLRPDKPYQLHTRGGIVRQGGDLPATGNPPVRLAVEPSASWLAQNPQ